MSSETRVVVCVGSNCDAANVARALDMLAGVLSDFRASTVYRTAAVGGGKDYANAVACGSTDLSSEELDALFKRYELAQGRDKTARALGCVPVDIDIVISAGEVVRPWDFRQSFFRIGYSELAGSVIEIEADGEIDKIGNPHSQPW